MRYFNYQKIIISLVLVLYPCLYSFAQFNDPLAHREPISFFKLNMPLLYSGKVQFFYELINKDGTVYKSDAAINSPNNGDTFKKFQAMDINATWKNKKPDDEYFISMTRVAYILNNDITYFTKARATDANYMNKVATDMNVRPASDDSTGTVFYKPKDGLIPSAKFSVHYYDKKDFQSKPPKEIQEFLSLEPELKLPDHVVVQNNFDIGTVMLISPVKNSVAFTSHYDLGNGKTLVINYTLNYINHIFGMQDTLFEETATRVLTGIRNVRKLSATAQEPKYTKVKLSNPGTNIQKIN